jgi:hypothetical protein
LEKRVNDPRLAFAGKVGLGPFWTLVQVWSYEHVLQLFVSTFVSPSGTSVYLPSERSTRGCKCKIYLTVFNLINYNKLMTTMGCMVDDTHLDKKYIQHTLPKRKNMRFINNYCFDSDCVHIFLNKLI